MSRVIAEPIGGPVASSDPSSNRPLSPRTFLSSGEEVVKRRARSTRLRVRRSHVEWLLERLGDRDRAVLASVHRLRLINGQQLERLHFQEIVASARGRVRRRVLARLVAWRVLMTLDRRIGGVRAGSAGLVFMLDSAGQKLMTFGGTEDQIDVRRATEPSTALFGHSLAITELYVALVELGRAEGLTVRSFSTEPACWWPNGLGSYLKPDAYFEIASHQYSDAWWLEQDMGSQHLPTIRRKLTTYLDFALSGQVGPSGVVPRLLISVRDDQRREAVNQVIQRLPSPAAQMLQVATSAKAASYLLGVLKGVP